LPDYYSVAEKGQLATVAPAPVIAAEVVQQAANEVPSNGGEADEETAGDIKLGFTKGCSSLALTTFPFIINTK
jgi:hypothetical protein